MKPDPQTARQALINAQQALQRGDRRAARRWAEMTAALAPEWEESWLILASLATPHASVTYLERALKINPQSERARAGMVWAKDRLQRSQEGKTPAEEIQPTQSDDLTQAHRIASDEAATAGAPPETQPQSQVQKTQPHTVAQTPPSSPHPVSSKAFVKYRWSFLTLVIVAVCVTLAWTFWPGNASSALAFLRAPQPTTAMLGAPADVEKPTYTPSPTSTFTPTATFTPSPTFTLTPSPTDTPIPTDTLLPTDTPWPSDTPLPWPTETPYSYPTGESSGGTRWIDVNLSQQMLYAYEGDTAVASFLVSTGVWQFPTVTGQYHIYVKYESTLMTGVGYYLPNVPYTMYFYEGYGIHGTYWHNNFGTPMSHGCVNMYTPDAEWLYNWASVGTLVNIHY